MNKYDQLPKLEDENPIYVRIDGETEEQFIQRHELDYAAKAINVPPALLARASTFIRAMASKLFEKETTPELQIERLNICYGCPEFEVSMKRPELQGHCRACGCGKTALASLAHKSKIAATTCPKNKWPIQESPDALPVFSRRAE
jgi:hypothetical protein